MNTIEYRNVAVLDDGFEVEANHPELGWILLDVSETSEEAFEVQLYQTLVADIEAGDLVPEGFEEPEQDEEPEYIEWRDVRETEHSEEYNCEINHTQFGWIPFTARADGDDLPSRVYADIVAAVEAGEIEPVPYTPPNPFGDLGFHMSDELPRVAEAKELRLLLPDVEIPDGTVSVDDSAFADVPEEDKHQAFYAADAMMSARQYAYDIIFNELNEFGESQKADVLGIEASAFDSKVVDAKAIMAGELEGNMLVVEAQKTGEDPGDLAQLILAKHAGLKVIVGIVTGLRRKAKKLIYEATTLPEIGAVVASINEEAHADAAKMGIEMGVTS